MTRWRQARIQPQLRDEVTGGEIDHQEGHESDPEQERDHVQQSARDEATHLHTGELSAVSPRLRCLQSGAARWVSSAWLTAGS